MIQIVHGVVLKAEEQNEFDKRITLFTKEFGKLRAKVTGVKKSGSKLKGLTLPFCELRLQIFLAGTPRAGVREPGKLISGEILNHHTKIQSDFEKTVQASALCEIMEILTREFNPNLKEYQILTSSLEEMELTSSPELVRCRFTLRFLKAIGLSLLHHPTWKLLSEKERTLLKSLASWNVGEQIFYPEEASSLENITRRYLAQYLPSPLKTDQFQQKLAVGI